MPDSCVLRYAVAEPQLIIFFSGVLHCSVITKLFSVEALHGCVYNHSSRLLKHNLRDTVHTSKYDLFLFQHQYLTEALQWRAQTDADHVLFVLLNAKVSN